MIMFLVASVISFLIAIGCAWACVKALIMQRRKQATSTFASGVVVELQKRVFNPGSAGVYCPVIEFRTGSSQVVRFESSFGTMPATHRVGQTVRVFYNPKEPQTAEIESGLSSWLVPGCLLALVVFGVFFSVMFLALHFLIVSSGARLSEMLLSTISRAAR
jgi:Protein of unknown function (DUF3592)